MRRIPEREIKSGDLYLVHTPHWDDEIITKVWHFRAGLALGEVELPDGTTLRLNMPELREFVNKDAAKFGLVATRQPDHPSTFLFHKPV